ncbi:metallophosphoesterase family protein [uncultured Campylobacter sp.]|uniref:metallophosphoesterase family protein n=1 Tax=uncultured Campylobacter sp. TaxID=218934 RepID=UPI002612AFC6|nr:metallophosphoesterase family protein [uncultured Campylobacter sp.]
MIIGVISDSHRETKVAAGAIEWLLARGADLLVHAEGIVESETLRLLRQSGKPYFAVLGNNDEALAELKNDFNLYDEPFCTEFAGLRLKIMHHPFYLFDEESAAQNEADGLNLDADLGAGADRGEILISNSKTASCSANLDANFNAADVDEILNGARGADANFKNIRSASANFKGGQSASLNVSLGVNTGEDVNSNANLDLSLGAYSASSPNANLNSNLTASSDPNTSGEGKNRGSCERGADKIPTIKIYGHTHYLAAAVNKNGALVLNPGEICGRKKRLFEFAYVVAQGGKFHVFHVCAAPEKALKWRECEIKL